MALLYLLYDLANGTVPECPPGYFQVDPTLIALLYWLYFTCFTLLALPCFLYFT
jgi:hypothetical protein